MQSSKIISKMRRVRHVVEYHDNKNVIFEKGLRRIYSTAKRIGMRNAGHWVSGCGSESLRAAYSARAASETDSVTVDASASTEKPEYKTSGPLQRRPR